MTSLREAAALQNEFNPDWDRIEALRESLREHMADVRQLRAALAWIASHKSSDWPMRCQEMVDKARAALAEKPAEQQDHVAYNGWVLREVLFDNGEPVGHRKPTKAEPQGESGMVKLPTSTEEAEAMQKIGYAYLRQYAPERLAEPQEPVAYMHCPSVAMDGKVRPVLSFEKYEGDYASGIYAVRVPLYPAPQPAKREPLTDREVGAIMEELNAYGTRLWEFARAIERAHGITGETK